MNFDLVLQLLISQFWWFVKINSVVLITSVSQVRHGFNHKIVFTKFNQIMQKIHENNIGAILNNDETKCLKFAICK